MSLGRWQWIVLLVGATAGATRETWNYRTYEQVYDQVGDWTFGPGNFRPAKPVLAREMRLLRQNEAN